jgi:hypothetical protein
MANGPDRVYQGVHEDFGLPRMGALDRGHGTRNRFDLKVKIRNHEIVVRCPTRGNDD